MVCNSLYCNRKLFYKDMMEKKKQRYEQACILCYLIYSFSKLLCMFIDFIVLLFLHMCPEYAQDMSFSEIYLSG
jgi:hypothetical protein